MTLTSFLRCGDVSDFNGLSLTLLSTKCEVCLEILIIVRHFEESNGILNELRLLMLLPSLSSN